MLKKLLIKAASGIVLEVLLVHATKMRDKMNMSETHYQRWNTVVSFLVDMQTHGLPL